MQSYRSSESRFNFENVKNVVVLTIVVVFMGIAAFVVFNYLTVTGSVSSCTVVGKEEHNLTKGKKEFRIVTEGCEGSGAKTLQLTDNLLSRSETRKVYDSLEIGKTYDFETRGAEVPFISPYSKITQITPSN